MHALVARQHREAEAQALESFECRPGGRIRNVADREVGRRFVSQGDEHGDRRLVRDAPPADAGLERVAPLGFGP